ncbi:MAG: phosphoribosyltransferase [Geminicoccaceae bacterium]|nr:phosphoribosyltransferase [Geminicoccaceae bacterium]
MFADRAEAGRALAAALDHLRDEAPVVLALPRGGVPVALPIARRLGCPLDLLLVRKLGVPGHEELAAGALVDEGEVRVVQNDDVIRAYGITPQTLDAVIARERREVERRRRLYLGDRQRAGVAGRTAIVVDDGIATGATVRAALAGLKAAKPRRLVVAVPVAPPETVAALRREVDGVVTLATPERFHAIGAFYRNFTQVSDEEVRAALAS